MELALYVQTLSLCVNAHGKGMNPPVLPKTMGK